MTLEVGLELPELHELGGGEEAGLGPSGVEDGRGVTLGEDEAVVRGALRLSHIVPVQEESDVAVHGHKV